MSQSLLVLLIAGPLVSPVAAAAEKSEAAAAMPLAPVVAELVSKDTDKIDVITAGETQKSSFGQCADAADVELCRILIGAVNAAAIIGSSVTGQ